MKFEFEFEALLNIRRHEEKKEQQKLGRLLQEQLELGQKIESFKGRLQKFEDKTSDEESQKALAIRHQYELKQDLQEKIWQLQKKDQQLEKAIADQRHRLLEANKNTQMLEKLKDRERAEFIEEFQRAEQLQQNEIATQMYNRSS